jgi:TonB family protein
LSAIPVETDVAELAARFAEKGGGGITPEMSSELALEVVLNEIVEQACQLTNATGSAIALDREGEMVCRASSGATAPDLGARLDTSSGLTGDCCNTRQTQTCQDALSDARVDIEASARLGVRSVIVMPLLRGADLVGVFELLSCWPAAFTETEEGIMGELARRAIRSLDRAELAVQQRPEAKPQPMEKPTETPKEQLPDAYPAQDLDLARKIAEIQRAEIAHAASLSTEPLVPETLAATFLPTSTQPVSIDGVKQVRRGGFDFLSFALGAAVLACTALLGVMVGRRFEERRVDTRSHHSAAVPAAAVPSRPAPTVDPGSSSSDANASQLQAAPLNSSAPAGSAVPPGGLVVYDGGKEVFRLPPNQAGSAAAATKPPGPVLQLSPAAAENILTNRVEPEYPDEALLKKIQGAVVLAIRIGGDGSVQDMQFVSGPPQLEAAAMDAVKRWRFKPQTVNGKPAQVETSVSLNFRLPVSSSNH